MREQTGYGEAGLQEAAKNFGRGNGVICTRSGRRRRRRIACEIFVVALRLSGVTRGRQKCIASTCRPAAQARVRV